jgi:hypothetical protein
MSIGCPLSARSASRRRPQPSHIVAIYSVEEAGFFTMALVDGRRSIA